MKKYVSSLIIALFVSLSLFAFVNAKHAFSLDDHDVGIADVTVDCAVVWYFSPSMINVTVVNYGVYDETVNITIYAGSVPIGEVNGIAIASGNSLVSSTMWDGRGDPIGYGSYTLGAYVHPVADETETMNNTFVDGIIKLARRGDADGNGVITVLDLILIASKLGRTPPFDWGYPMPHRIDANNDKKVNVLDLILVAGNLGM